MGILDDENFGYTGKTVISEAKVGEWKKLSEDPIYQGMLKNRGIPFFNSLYLNVNRDQDNGEEFVKMIKFINQYKMAYAKNHNQNPENIKFEFINYGNTEIVFVMDDENGKSSTILVKQPAVEVGRVKQEADNLIELSRKYDNIVAPTDYFRHGDIELYATPYMNQARCIASLCGDFGMYIPEPYYRFVAFSQEKEDVVTSCMIAKLVSMYDLENNCGISACKLGGGDFMFPKDFEKYEKNFNVKTVLDNLYLIAARDKIYCSLDDYINIIKNEFTRATIREDQSSVLINHRARAAMTIDCIEKGIDIGIQMLGKNQEAKIKKENGFEFD